MKLAIGNDHTALAIKEELLEHLAQRTDVELVDVGTNAPESYDYAISAYRVSRLVADGEVDGGILICGTGVGISLAANKVHGIRACVCSEPYSAELSKRHNNSNVICFGARVVGPEVAKQIVDAWLNAEFEGGRHERRVNQIMEIEETQHLAAAEG